MEKILKAIQEKIDLGYTYQKLAVMYGSPGGTIEEGYYLSMVNGWGRTPITEILCFDGDIDDEEFKSKLEKLGVEYFF